MSISFNKETLSHWKKFDENKKLKQNIKTCHTERLLKKDTSPDNDNSYNKIKSTANNNKFHNTLIDSFLNQKIQFISTERHINYHNLNKTNTTDDISLDMKREETVNVKISQARRKRTIFSQNNNMTIVIDNSLRNQKLKRNNVNSLNQNMRDIQKKIKSFKNRLLEKQQQQQLLINQQEYQNEEFVQKFKVKIAKQSAGTSINSIRINRINIKQFLMQKYNERVVERLITFLELPYTIDFQIYVKYVNQIANLSKKTVNLLCFMIYDMNEDGFLCNNDLFSYFKIARQIKNARIDSDINKIMRFVQHKLNILANYKKDDSAIEQLILRNQNLTMTDYLIYLKKSQIVQIPNEIKKDTTYPYSFQAREHSAAIRFTNFQMEENSKQYEKKKIDKKTFYIPQDSFCLNFDQFQLIFDSYPPLIYIDILDYFGIQKKY